MKPPKISVGILTEKEIEIEFFGRFFCDNNLNISGIQKVVFQKGKIFFDDKYYKELIFNPENDDSFFELKNVTIGKEFHWQQKENQRFTDSLKLIVEDKKITAINIISVENYLKSVISSEMSASASLELLKAHAVISRSWLLANKQQNNLIHLYKSSFIIDNQSFIKWYERDAHSNFDVCADDHCQRYQGISRQTNENVNQAVRQTEGIVLMYEDGICDARYSKSCGGISEQFENCWADVHFSYLESITDAPQGSRIGGRVKDLTKEENAKRWILSSPKCFCNTHDTNVLVQVLNNYDRATTDFFRWTCHFSQNEITEIIYKKSGFDFGQILDLIPVRRGLSSRIVELKIVGTKKILIVGKELEIRKWLSQTHLYSSAFVVEKCDFHDNIPQKFILHGAGWGHGVGLCQIGAAVMGERAYKFDEILAHYFKNSELKKIY
ncbi:MAG: SpoIID/LytB domain-containing protein [Paludibacter sp.]|nr:SpoIID/LytB domain-containing protein [Paludibacter sp.]